jgi:succinate dehydrogenase flavin-adding protein (antitoxin of CptAB toxin-antitoxin module)
MLILLGLLVLGAVIAATFALLSKEKQHGESVSNPEGEDPHANLAEDECCGAHEICDKDLEKLLSDTPVYFDDEELDRFRGANPQSYTDSEIDEFQDILITLKDSEIQSWFISLDKRGIIPPAIVREEGVVMVREYYDKRNNASLVQP